MPQIGDAINAVTSSSPRTFTVTSSSQLVLAANPARAGLSVINDSGVEIYLGLAQAAAVGSDISLYPGGGSWDGRVSQLVWTGAVYAIAASGSSNNLCVVEV